MLTSGTRVGGYEIVSSLGAGGMGEVYRAHDTKLKRDVALKILPEQFTSDPDRLARFQREAEVLATLNHPHIAHIYGLEETGDVRALVMELVDGEDLAQRIARGPITLDEALPIARQMAEALEAAHEQSVIHRDLKPANIKVRDDGTVKVLDFGLAKAMEPGASSMSSGAGLATLANSPTITSPALTLQGMLLGTAAYMSPEQAKGRPADKRSDIWAFGCVLYEMLTGTRAFPGEDASDTLAAVLRTEPEWSRLPHDWPGISEIARLCLAKDPKARPGDIAVVRYLLARCVEPLPPMPARKRWIAAAAVVAALVLLLGSVAVTWSVSRPSPPEPTRFTVPLTGSTAMSFGGPATDVAVSPDGTLLIYVTANGPGESQAMVRHLNQLDATPLQGAQPASSPFFSPDGRWLAFTAQGGTVRKTLVDGGTPTPTLICNVTGTPVGGTWTVDDTIIFGTADPDTGLIAVPADGGDLQVLTTPDKTRGEFDHLSPFALPDGRRVLFTIKTGPTRDDANIGLFDRRSGQYQVVLRGGSQPQYLEPGYLVFGAGDRLNAVPFDLRRGEVTGTPLAVAQPVAAKLSGATEYSVSRNGTLVYMPAIGGTGAGGGTRMLVWVDREGRETPVDAPPRAYVYARIAPDGEQVALDVRDQQQDIWLWRAGRFSRVTVTPALDAAPLWAPEGRRIVYSSQRAGVANLYVQAPDPSAEARRLTNSPSVQVATAFTPDGQSVIVNESVPGVGVDLAVVSLQDGATSTLLRSAFNESNADVAPDGRFIVYQSDQSGQPEVYVRPFPNVNDEVFPVSINGGSRPRWSPTGRELFYFDAAGALMSAPVELAPRFTVGTPVKAVDAGYFRGTPAVAGRTYDVSRDGKRFLMLKDLPQLEGLVPEMIVVVNWVEQVKRLLASTSR